MSGVSIAPQVILALATLGGVSITATAAELRARRQERIQARQREEDRAEERRVRFHEERLIAVSELLAASDAFLDEISKHFEWCRERQKRAESTAESFDFAAHWKSAESPAANAARAAEQAFDAARVRVSILFSDAQFLERLNLLAGGMTAIVASPLPRRPEWSEDLSQVVAARRDLVKAAREYFAT